MKARRTKSRIMARVRQNIRFRFNRKVNKKVEDDSKSAGMSKLNVKPGLKLVPLEDDMQSMLCVFHISKDYACKRQANLTLNLKSVSKKYLS